tara:strand:- start:112 stop:837 length:726 start_codon:yes stop_codon:yes gene_type:complete
MNSLKKTRKNLLKIINNSNKRYLSEKRRYQLNRDVEVIIKDKPPKDVDINKILSLIRDNIPDIFLNRVKSVKIGNFDILKKRNISALHDDGHIYIDSNQEGEVNFIDDFVHEIAHCVEEKFAEDIYEDQKIVNEFLGKRNRLYDLLHNDDVDYKLNYFDFLNLDYDKEFDDLLFKKIGYKKIENIAPTLFVRAYAATSLREYFATAFESYYLKGGNSIKDISPQVYKKLIQFEKIADFDPK